MKPPKRPRTMAAVAVAAAATVVATSLTASGAAAHGHHHDHDVDAEIEVDLDDATAISDRLYGLFYEDINHAADGGLYAELVQNRSFEFSPADNGSYHALTAWTVEGDAVVTDNDSLNENNVNHLSAAAGSTIVNAGYNSGMNLQAGAAYDFSVWAKTGSGAELTVQLLDATGTAASEPATVTAPAGEWTKLEATLGATASTIDGRLSVSTDAEVALDMVSLFPEETFMDRENGLRPDLAQLIAELEPSFLRFPGGCLVNTGSFDPDSRQRFYNWKDTVGPVEERKANFNTWGYNQTYGLGYYEYFQFAEDIGAEALPVVQAGVTGCGWNEVATPEQVDQLVQDALDLIEFANGGADTEWGSLRAQMGHPEPFGLEYIAVGNEEPNADGYAANYPEFDAAIREAYPEMQVIANSGPDDQGTVFDRGWELAREYDADLVDEHYYNSPEWFFSNNDRYDSYDRQGPHVFLGEYASRSNTWWSALSEASYLTGIERNGDVVDLASYAPLLSNIDYVDWAPDMIWFDNHQAVKSASYEIQKLFSTNAGDEVFASELEADPIEQPDIAGGIGLATWNTAATYDDVKVTAADGSVLFEDDFADGAGAWTPSGPGGTPTGTWEVVDGAYQQTAIVTDARSVAGEADWSNYTMEVQATKTAGDEGFLIMFGVEGSDDYYWWNLGGWGNTTSALEKSSGGGKSTLVNHDTVIETGRTYDLRLEVRGRTITGFVDGEQVFSVVDEQQIEPLYQVVTRDEETGAVTIKVVNAQDHPMTTEIELEGQKLKKNGSVTTIACDPGCDNILGEEPVVYPVTDEKVHHLGNEFTYEFEPYSVTFIELEPRGRH